MDSYRPSYSSNAGVNAGDASMSSMRGGSRLMRNAASVDSYRPSYPQGTVANAEIPSISSEMGSRRMSNTASMDSSYQPSYSSNTGVNAVDAPMSSEMASRPMGNVASMDSYLPSYPPGMGVDAEDFSTPVGLRNALNNLFKAASVDSYRPSYPQGMAVNAEIAPMSSEMGSRLMGNAASADSYRPSYPQGTAFVHGNGSMSAGIDSYRPTYPSSMAVGVPTGPSSSAAAKRNRSRREAKKARGNISEEEKIAREKTKREKIAAARERKAGRKLQRRLEEEMSSLQKEPDQDLNAAIAAFSIVPKPNRSLDDASAPVPSGPSAATASDANPSPSGFTGPRGHYARNGQFVLKKANPPGRVGKAPIKAPIKAEAGGASRVASGGIVKKRPQPQVMKLMLTNKGEAIAAARERSNATRDAVDEMLSGLSFFEMHSKYKEMRDDFGYRGLDTTHWEAHRVKSGILTLYPQWMKLKSGEALQQGGMEIDGGQQAGMAVSQGGIKVEEDAEMVL